MSEYAFKKGQEYEREKILKDLEEYQFSIGCTYCDCEKKMWKLQKKWEDKKNE